MYVYFLLRGDEFPLFHSGWYLSIVLLLASPPLLVGTSYIGGGGCRQAVQYSPLFQFAEKRGPQSYWKVLVQCTAAINGFLKLADTHT